MIKVFNKRESLSLNEYLRTQLRTYHFSSIMSNRSLCQTILSKTLPRARPSCRLKVALNPMIGIFLAGTSEEVEEA